MINHTRFCLPSLHIKWGIPVCIITLWPLSHLVNLCHTEVYIHESHWISKLAKPYSVIHCQLYLHPNTYLDLGIEYRFITYYNPLICLFVIEHYGMMFFVKKPCVIKWINLILTGEIRHLFRGTMFDKTSKAFVQQVQLIIFTVSIFYRGYYRGLWIKKFPQSNYR